MEAIEAAARAIWARRNPNRKEAFPRAGVLREVIFADARAAIAAYLEATGVKRDAERYRHFRLQFGLAVWGGDGQIAWHEEEIDKIIDNDILEAKAARGGEHG